MAAVSNARSRLARALAVSAAVHVWLATGAAIHVPHAALPPISRELTVFLEPIRPRPASPPHALDRAPESDAAPGPYLPGGDRPVRHASPAHQKEDTAAPALPPETAPEYSAHELDVYPRPLAPLDFGDPARTAGGSVRGRVAVTVLIDELGVVRDIRVVDAAPAGQFGDTARTVLASARFAPGRKDGRAVRSRLTIEVEYAP